MGRLAAFACSLAIVACATKGGAVRSGHAPDCGEIPAGVLALLRPANAIVLGDLPGTREVPRVVGAIACHAAATGVPARLVLEVPTSERARIKAFLRSRGEGDDRLDLIRGPFWMDRRVGASRATLELLDSVRAWRRAGLPIEVVSARDWLRDRDPGEGVVVALLSPRRTMVADAIALRVVAGGGTRWRCTDAQRCGIAEVAGAGDGVEPRVRWHHPPAGWDGVLYVGVVSASPPVLEPPAGEDFDNPPQM
jgi:hypothetical protein